MDIINLSSESLGKLHSWLPFDLKAKKVIFLPDACPGKSPLPTGTAVLTSQEDWRHFAISDCGCGMRLLKTSITHADLTLDTWNAIAAILRQNKGTLGDLGGGNHFLDALLPYTEQNLYILIHTGSRAESGLVDAFIDKPQQFDAEFTRVKNWAAENRAAIQNAVEKIIGKVDVVLDLPHNTYENLENGEVIIRKGAVHLKEGELTIIPSHMSGDAVLVRGTNRMSEILDSLSHGTGRAMSRSECKPLADTFDFDALRKQILLPTDLQNESLRTEGPFAYREIDSCLQLLSGYIDEVQRFSVVAYMGHL